MGDAPHLEGPAPAQPPRGRLRRLASEHALVFLGFACLAVLMSWPMPRGLGRYLGDSEDPIFSAWNFAWITHNVVDGVGRLWDGNIFYPYRQTLSLGDPSFTNSLIALPFVALTRNAIVGHNVVVLFALTMAGFGAYLVAWDLLRQRLPALFAGFVFAASPFLIHNAFNIQSLSCYWLPFLYLAVERFRRQPTWGNAALCWCMGALLALSGVYFTFYGGVILLIMVVTGVLALGNRWSLRHFARLGAVSFPFIACVAWAYLPYLSWYRTGETSRSVADAAAASASLDNFVMVPPQNLLHRGLGLFVESTPTTSPLYPGLVAGVMAIVGAVALVRTSRGKRSAPDDARQAISHVGALIGAFVLSLGPTAVVGGLSLPLPYQWLYWLIPPFKALRTPNRFGGPLQLAVAVLAAVGFGLLCKYLQARGRTGWQRAAGIGVPVLAALEFATFPFPGTTQRYPDRWMKQRKPSVEWLRGVEGRGAILELPKPAMQVLLYEASVHLKPMVAGVSSFNPPLYDELVAVMRTFPSEESWVLLHSLPLDYVLVRKKKFSEEDLTTIQSRPEIMTLERELGPHLIFRAATHSSSLGRLALAVSVEPGPGGSEAPRLVASLGNATNQPLPFYPVHSVTAEVRSGDELLCRTQRPLPLFLKDEPLQLECPLSPDWEQRTEAEPALEVHVDVSSATGSRQLEKRIVLDDEMVERQR